MFAILVLQTIIKPENLHSYFIANPHTGLQKTV